MSYFQYLSGKFAPAGHHCDLVAYFFRQAFALISSNGCFGFICTNTISQGDTREGGLEPILKDGGNIIRAVRRLRWPGEAAVIVRVLHVTKRSNLAVYIDGRPVTRISAFVVAGDVDASPRRLANSYYSLGSKIYGQGFLFDDHDLKANSTALLKEVRADPVQSARVFRYIVGEDLNKHPRHESDRLVIQLSDLDTEDGVQAFPILYQAVKEKVYPERMKLGSNPNNVPLRRRWWAYQAHRPELYNSIKAMRRVLCIARVSPHMAFCMIRPDVIFSEMVVVIADERLSSFATIQSRVHEVWARFLASSLKDDLRYTPSDCFETFPFPPNFQTDPALEAAGQAYHDHRARLMAGRNEGMTKTYNRFHDPEAQDEGIVRLRALHAAMDRAVLAAYGWHDLAERAEPIFLDETKEDDHNYRNRLFWPSDFRDEVLSRLLALNAVRHAEEVAAGRPVGMTPNGNDTDDDEADNESDST